MRRGGAVTGRAPRRGFPGVAPGAGRAREGLGDVQPAVGVRADGGQGEVGAVGALGDEQAEIDRGAGDPLRGVLGTMGPQLARGGADLDAELVLRRGQSPYREGEVPGPHTDADHMPEPVGGCAPHTQGVGHVLAVGPGLHEPAGGHGGGRHGRPEPGEPGVPRGRLPQGVVQLPPAVPPAGEQFGGAEPDAFLGAVVHEGAGRRERLLGELLEGRLVAHGEQGGPVGPVQMGDLVGDAPARSGRRACPLALGQLGHEQVEFPAFLTQVVEDGRRIGHGQEHGSGGRNNQACLH
jgi:hypothetical protein